VLGVSLEQGLRSAKKERARPATVTPWSGPASTGGLGDDLIGRATQIIAPPCVAALAFGMFGMRRPAACRLYPASIARSATKITTPIAKAIRKDRRIDIVVTYGKRTHRGRAPIRSSRKGLPRSRTRHRSMIRRPSCSLAALSARGRGNDFQLTEFLMSDGRAVPSEDVAAHQAFQRAR
jgi:hypothetical protein